MKIYPRHDLYGVFAVPPDKSITHRAIILGSMAKGKTYVIHPLICEDTQETISCVKKLGAKATLKDGIIEIKGGRPLRDGLKLDCGNSGTTMRLLCGEIAGSGVKAVLQGDRSLCSRPMKTMKIPLERMGATVALTNYSVPPILVEGAKVRPIEYTMPCDSAQVKSAILLCALAGGVEAVVHEKNGSRDHTEILLDYLGADISVDKKTKTITLKKSELKGKRIYIGGDFSAAIYFLALGLLLGKVTCRNVGVNPTRIGIVPVLRRMGARIEITNKRMLCGELIADITAYKSELTATHVIEDEITGMIDDIPVLAVLMGLAKGESIISGASELQYKECDRLVAIADMINAVGGRCRKIDGGLVVNGVGSYNGGDVKTYGDHRIAMSGAIALVCSRYGGEIDNEDCVSISFPGFFDVLKKNNFGLLGKNVSSSPSNKIHSFILDKFGLTTFGYSYINAEEDGLKRAYSELREYEGYNVTVPYKGEAYKHVLKSYGDAKTVKSVNTVKRLSGYTTDGDGFLMMLKNHGIDVAGKKVLVVGAGGAGRSVIAALVSAKANVDVYNRTAKTAIELRKKLPSISVLGEIPESPYDVVVNATSVGSRIDPEESPVRKETLAACGAAADVVYDPSETVFLKTAKELGRTAINGFEMLFFQAYLSDCIFTGKEPSEDEAFALYREYVGIEEGKPEEKSGGFTAKIAGKIATTGKAVRQKMPLSKHAEEEKAE